MLSKEPFKNTTQKVNFYVLIRKGGNSPFFYLLTIYYI